MNIQSAPARRRRRAGRRAPWVGAAGVGRGGARGRQRGGFYLPIRFPLLFILRRLGREYPIDFAAAWTLD